MRKLSQNKKIKMVLMLGVAAIIFCPIALIKWNNIRETTSMASRSIPPVAVAVAEASIKDWRQFLFAVGSMVADQGIEVTAPLPGTTTDIHFESGQMVTKGEPLISQDTGIPRAELSGLRATLKLRENQFRRSSKLYATKQISKADFDDSAAMLEEAKAAVAAKTAYITRKTVYAPFDGLLGIRMIDMGSYLNPGDPIVPLHTVNPIHVDYALPEKFIGRIFVGQIVEVEVAAYPGKKFVGRIKAFDPAIDASTRNVKIRASFDNKKGLLRPGMFAEVLTIDAKTKKVIVLPDTAITYSPYGNTLFVVRKGEGGLTVQKQQIQVGKVQGRFVEIISGIEIGEKVVAAGQNKLRNGMAVVIAESLKIEE